MSKPTGPYTYMETRLMKQAPGGGHVYMLDATGRKIATVWGKAAEKIALAEWICENSKNADRIAKIEAENKRLLKYQSEAMALMGKRSTTLGHMIAAFDWAIKHVPQIGSDDYMHAFNSAVKARKEAEDD